MWTEAGPTGDVTLDMVLRGVFADRESMCLFTRESVEGGLDGTSSIEPVGIVDDAFVE